MNKLKDMVSAVTKDSTNLKPKIIAEAINVKFGESKTEKDISDFLQSQFYPEEIQKLEARHKGFDGRFYM